MYDPAALKIYIDGSAPEANPGGPGGIGVIIEFPDGSERPNERIKKGYFFTTSNRMELLALLEALKYLRRFPSSSSIHAVIVTDSMYVYDGYRNAQYWQRDDWTGRSGMPTANVDLWRKLFSLRRAVKIHISLKREPGKSSEILREVDKLAKSAAAFPKLIDFGYQPGRVSRTKTGGGGAAVLFPARGQTEIIRFYGGRLAGKEYYKIKFETFSTEAGSYTQKYCAYIPKEWRHDLHRNHCYEVRFNDDSRFPKIVEFKPLEQCP